MQICTCRQQAVSLAVYSHLTKTSNLDGMRRMNFESFDTRGRLGLGEEERQSLELARSLCEQYAHSLKGWLFMQGGYGCGKTHLAVAIANFAIDIGVPTLFLTVPDLLDWLRYSYDSPSTSFETRFEDIRNIPLLILDDLGTQNATPWAQEKLFQIINHRYTQRLPMVVTSNQDLAEIEGRIQSRLQDAELVTMVQIKSPDFRLPTRDIAQQHVSTLSLLNHMTFGNFTMREWDRLPAEHMQSLENAFRAAQQFAEAPRGWLVLTGPYGCGKTHLAASIGNYRSAMGYPVVFWVVPDLLDHLRSTFSPNRSTSYDHSFEEVRLAPLLILDDLGTQSATQWAREKLYQLFNYRYIANLPTVITTANPLEELDPRIRTRMLDLRICQVNAILASAFRGGISPEKPRRTTRKPLTH